MDPVRIEQWRTCPCERQEFQAPVRIEQWRTCPCERQEFQAPVRIEQWRTCPCERQEFQAPELRDHLHLFGLVGGKQLFTSRVMKTEGRLVTTRNTTYRLGRPDPSFLAWMREHGLKYDSKQPVKVR